VQGLKQEMQVTVQYGFVYQAKEWVVGGRGDQTDSNWLAWVGGLRGVVRENDSGMAGRDFGAMLKDSPFRAVAVREKPTI